MARARNPKRDEAYQLYADSGGQIKLADLAAQLCIPASRIRKWKTEDKWDEKITERSDSVKRSAPIDSRDKKGRFVSGNTAAVGHGAPLRNTNAVKTGEHQTIWLDQLTPDEQVLYHTIGTDPLVQINEDIKLLTYRERNMLRYLNELKEQKKLAETKNVYKVADVPVIVEVYDEATGESRKQKITKQENVLVERTETTKMLISQILRIEEALTRVQDKKIKALEAKNKIMQTIDIAAADDVIVFNFERGARNGS